VIVIRAVIMPVIFMAPAIIALAAHMIVIVAAVQGGFAQVAPSTDLKDRDQALSLPALALRASPAIRIIRRGDLLETNFAGFTNELE
jgi:hypothetical protein